MRSLLLAAAFLAAATPAFADDTCSTAVNNALAEATSATITLATATKYMTSHDDWCDGNVMALEQQDADAVHHAWAVTINAQSVCMADDQAQLQLNKLIVSLHKRSIKIDDTMASLRAKCQ